MTKKKSEGKSTTEEKLAHYGLSVNRNVSMV